MKPDQLSNTAAFIAIKLFGLTRIDSFRSMFEDDVILFYDRLVKNLPAPLRYYHYWLQYEWVRSLYIKSEELLLPGDLLHIIARKWYIRNQVQELTNKGYEQILVLGAGFDDLAFTFTQKGYSCFEFEAPHMAAQKRAFLRDCYSNMQHPFIIDSYLPQDRINEQIKQHPQINPDKKTIIIAEGFFDYLTRQTVSKMLSEIHSYFKNKPVLISTHFALDELPIHHQWTFKVGVKTVGEKLQLNSTIADFKTLLTKNHYAIQKNFNSEEMTRMLQKKTGTHLSVLKGFYLLVAN